MDNHAITLRPRLRSTEEEKLSIQGGGEEKIQKKKKRGRKKKTYQKTMKRIDLPYRRGGRGQFAKFGGGGGLSRSGGIGKATWPSWGSREKKCNSEMNWRRKFKNK